MSFLEEKKNCQTIIPNRKARKHGSKDEIQKNYDFFIRLFFVHVINFVAFFSSSEVGVEVTGFM